MDCAIVENNIIINVVVIPDDCRPEEFGGKELPSGKWIGDEYYSDPVTWDELDKAYQEGYHEGYTEGVNTAYDQ